MVNIPIIQDVKTSPFGEFLGGIGSGIGGGVGNILKQKIVQSALSDVDFGDDDAVRRAVLGLPPELQQQALGVISATTPKPTKPPLTANEELNQISGRQTRDLNQTMAPHAIMDNVGKFLAFRGTVGEEKKRELIAKGQEIIDRGIRSSKNVYEKFGIDVPLDIIEMQAVPEEYRSLYGNAGAGRTEAVQTPKLDKVLKSGKKIKFDAKKPKHAALAQDAMKKAGGDKDEANEILRKFFID